MTENNQIGGNMEKVYIEGELAYPIYLIKFKWINQDDKEDGTSWTVMFKNDLTDEEQQEKLAEYGKQLEEKHRNTKCMGGYMEFLRYETWCLHWFNHYTFDIGQTDQEVLDSFERFVIRMTIMNEKNGHYNNQADYHQKNWADTYYCLMGAEDRWRWSGGDYENKTDPPCRCDGCKKYGVIRINH